MSGAVPYRDYIEALYEMAEEGIPMQQARLAEWLGIGPAAVSEGIKRLAERGLVKQAPDRRLSFTKQGERLARVLVRRHRLAERFLVEVVGLPWYLSHEEATRWGPVISDRVEERLLVILGDPATCVHGNPIPGSKSPVDLAGLRQLHEIPAGERVRLERLTEDLELDLDVMRFFEESGLMPGAALRVVGVAPDGTMTLRTDGRDVALGRRLTDNLWVRGG